jgi:hypothetical protein
MVNESGKKLGIIDFDIVCEYTELIGSPVPLDLEVMNNPEESKAFELDVKNIKTKYINIMEEKAKTQVPVQSQQTKSTQKMV